MEWIIIYDLPILFGYSEGEKIRVKGWAAHHRKYLTCLRIHDYNRSSTCMYKFQLIINRFFCSRLYMLIDRKHQIASRYWWLHTKHAYRFTGYIYFNLVATISAAYFLIIYLLQAELPDDVAHLVSIVLVSFEFLVIDFTDITKDMCTFGAV